LLISRLPNAQSVFPNHLKTGWVKPIKKNLALTLLNQIINIQLLILAPFQKLGPIEKLALEQLRPFIIIGSKKILNASLHIDLLIRVQ